MTPSQKKSLDSCRDSFRVLQVIPALAGGGAEEETILIAQALKRNGGYPLVASQGGGLVGFLEKEGIPHFSLPVASKNPFQILKNARRLEALVKAQKVDLIHVRSRAPAWSVALCARRTGIPWMTTYHAAYGGGWFLKDLYNSAMARGERVITISGYVDGHLRKTYEKASWFNPEKVRLIRRGINLETSMPGTVSEEEKEALRCELNLPKGASVLMLPGRFSRIKGHDLLLRAFALLRQQVRSQVFLLFVGETSNPNDGAYRLELQKLAKELGVTPGTRFLPYRHDMPAFYALADVVVVPSRFPEGFGRVIAEACAFEKCVVVSRHGAAPEIVLEGETGFLAEPHNIADLAKVLDKVLSLSEEEARRFQKNARNHVARLFSQEQFQEKTLDVYREILMPLA